MSNARKSLKSAYTDILKRIKIVNNARTDPKIKEYVIAAAIFLAHAEIENFITDIFSGYASGAQSIAKKGSQLPKELQSHLFLSKANTQTIFGNFVANGSEEKLLKSFISSLSGHAGAIVNDSVPLKLFSGKDIYTSKKYPSKDNLKIIFYRIGIDKVFAKCDAELGRNSLSLIESLACLRTQLAHTGTSTLPGISCNDVCDRIKGAELFVGGIDRLIYRSMTSQFGSKAWIDYAC
jgi:hypothetical protein